MTLSIRTLAVLVLLTASTAFAQYTTSNPYSPLTIPSPSGDSCTNTWYDPEVFVMPDGVQLGLLAQGGAPNSCQTLPYDAMFAGRRDLNGAWITPAANSCPQVKGEYIRCGWSGGSNAGPIASPSIVRVPNSNSASGYRYFMAFVGGNADYVHGKMYWAYSDDGTSWTMYSAGSPENWKPLIEAKYERDATARPRSTPACASPSAIGQVMLAYENGWMYVFAQYYHPIQPECTNPNSTACLNSPFRVYSGARSPWLFRFPYNSGHPFGFGGGWQVYANGSWQSHSGRLTWAYDRDQFGNQLPADTGNAVYQVYDSVQSFTFGSGDLKYGNGKWLHTRSFHDATYMQTATCLDPLGANGCGNWSAEQKLDLSKYKAVYSNLPEIIPVGLHYGALRKADGTYTTTQWWIWTPAPTGNKVCMDGTNRNWFAGLSLVPAQLCTPDVPCSP